MTGFLRGLEGTDAGQQVALVLVLVAAVLHAVFGALQKGQRVDPWVSRAAIDGCYGMMAAPLALFVVPWPEPHMWPIFAGALLIHVVYKIFQAMAYSRGAFTVVYPVMRGTGPLFTVIGAGIVFGEVFSAAQWLGVAVLLGGIFGLAAYNLRTISVDRNTMVPALGLAVITGGFVALYTTYDAYGIRATADPFTFLAWFFFLDGFLMPILTFRRLRALPRAQIGAVVRLGLIGAIVAFFSFGSVMLATRIGHVGQAAVLRETSTVFAAAIGWLMLGEKVGPRRLLLMTMIAAGAVIVQVSG
ncbi:MAG: EamA family transporter [Rhodobacteraceae bacterium]|nr:EamA family transporter [Paracoccaceae bacterium]